MIEKVVQDPARDFRDPAWEGRLRRKPPADLVAGVPIAGFTGVNGAGKTLLACESAIASMAAGIPVYSTVPIRSQWGNSEPVKSLRQLLELSDCVLLLDEVAAIFSSRTTQSLPAEVVTLLHSLRHRRVSVRWTAPEWLRADVNLRIVTQAVVNVVPLLRVRDGSLWPRPRVVLAGVMDTTAGKVDATPERVLRRRVYRPASLAAFGAYDTHADVPQLGGHVHSGVCVDCGGTVTRPKHSPERHAELGLPWYDA